MRSRKYSHLALSITQIYVEEVKRSLESGKVSELKKVKMKVLQVVLEHGSKGQSGSVEAKLNAVREHYALLVEGLKHLGYSVVEVDAVLGDKGLVGVSSGFLHAIYEVGLSWDYIFDLPYIPASSVKGAMRSWVFRRCSELDQSLKRSCAEKVLDLFGAPEGEVWHREEREWFTRNFGDLKSAEAFTGNIFVADAYPIDRGRGVAAYGLLVPDVMTPHYYSGGEVVADEFEAQPVPVQYLAIAPGTKFKFVVGVKEAGVPPSYVSELSSMLFGKQASSLTALVAGILANALAEGIGAKTGKGYSYFTVEKAVVHKAGASRRFVRGKYGKQSG